MFASTLIDLNANGLSLREGTVVERMKRLREAGVFAVGKQGPHGGAVMDERDVTNLFLACLLPHERGSDVAESTLKVRNTAIRSLVYSPTILSDGSIRSGADNSKQIARFTHGLRFNQSETLGHALEAIIRDLRSGAFESWAADRAHELIVELIDAGQHAQIYLSRPHEGTAVVFGYTDDPKPAAKHFVTRIVRIDGGYFQKIATAMGSTPT